MDIEYEDTHHIKQMRKLVNDYNELLRKTFIDIPEYNTHVDNCFLLNIVVKYK